MPRQNTSPTEYPQAVLQQIELLGQNIAIARKRRGETQAQWARRLGVSQPTMARIERGDPSVAMASYAMCMWLVNPAMAVADVIAPQNDHAALEREVTRVKGSRKAVKNAVPPGPSTATASVPSRSLPPAAVGLTALIQAPSGKAAP
jgi:DNA-binding XRE family transcriptional regulator